MRKFMVVLDDSRECLNAMRYAALRAANTGAGVQILSIISPEEFQHWIGIADQAAGFDWREPGCSMCLAMNDDRLKPEERCASTSNRNFEGRQGFKGRTHLVSPQMAAAAAIAGHFVDIREWK